MHKSLIEQQGFQLLEQIDNTLHTEIWKANQRELDRIVCLQILKPEAARNALELEHFLVIARIFAKVKSEAVAAVFDIVSTSDLHYVVMEYVDGPTVGSLVEQGHKLSQSQILQIASALAACFDQLWQKDRIIHRNLKGQTVQIDPRGVAKLTDFSLAVTASQDLGALDGGHIVGTPSFIAPEYAQGSKELKTQADMYSFGALLYQLATGHAPFASLSPLDALSAQIRSQVPPPDRLNPGISLEFSWFIHRLMMKNPVNRYPDWREVITDIHLLMQGQPPTEIHTEERFLSTIDVKPLLERMNALEEEEGEEDADDEDGDEDKAAGPASVVRVRKKNLKLSQVEREHRRDIVRSNIRLASVMTLLLLAWFAGLAWYRAVYEPEMKRISETLKRSPPEVVAPPPVVVVSTQTTAAGRTEVDTPPSAEGPLDPLTGRRKGEHRRDKPLVKLPLPAEPAPEHPRPAETNTLPQPVALAPMPEEVKKVLACAARAGNLEALRTAFAGLEKPFLEKEVITSILKKAPTSYHLLERTMDSKKDQTISFTWRGKSRIVVPREVTEASVTLEANGRRQEIKFSDLTPDEMVSLVNKPQSEAEALSYSLLLLGSTRKGEVPFYASKCLPLQEVLIEAMKEE